MDVFGSRLRASEGAYFKTVAERDIQRLAAERRRRRRADEATTAAIDGRVDASAPSMSSTTSRASAAHAYAMRGSAASGGVDKLAAVYAEETRLVGTTVGGREVRVRRTVGRDVDEAASSPVRARTRDSIFFAHGGASKLNRRDWIREVSADLRRAAAEGAAMSPMERKALEASHMAQRHAMVGGVRALAYGTVLALVGVVGGSAAASAMLGGDARGGEDDFGENFKSTFSPYVDRARTVAGPYREWVASMGQATDGDAAARVEKSAVVQNLRRRLRVTRPAPQSTST